MKTFQRDEVKIIGIALSETGISSCIYSNNRPEEDTMLFTPLRRMFNSKLLPRSVYRIIIQGYVLFIDTTLPCNICSIYRYNSPLQHLMQS